MSEAEKTVEVLEDDAPLAPDYSGDKHASHPTPEEAQREAWEAIKVLAGNLGYTIKQRAWIEQEGTQRGGIICHAMSDIYLQPIPAEE